MPKTGQYTGERLMRERPRAYREILRRLANGESQRRICRDLHVHAGTIRNLRVLEAQTIAIRKQSLSAIAARIAQSSAEQIEDQLAAGKFKGSQLIPVFGVAVDKLLLLAGEPTEHLRTDVNITGNIFHAFAQFHADAQRIISTRSLPYPPDPATPDAPPDAAHSPVSPDSTDIPSPDVSPDALQ
jgi:hypothetical protein